MHEPREVMFGIVDSHRITSVLHAGDQLLESSFVLRSNKFRSPIPSRLSTTSNSFNSTLNFSLRKLIFSCSFMVTSFLHKNQTNCIVEWMLSLRLKQLRQFEIWILHNENNVSYGREMMQKKLHGCLKRSKTLCLCTIHLENLKNTKSASPKLVFNY